MVWPEVSCERQIVLNRGNDGLHRVGRGAKRKAAENRSGCARAGARCRADGGRRGRPRTTLGAPSPVSGTLAVNFPALGIRGFRKPHHQVGRDIRGDLKRQCNQITQGSGGPHLATARIEQPHKRTVVRIRGLYDRGFKPCDRYRQSRRDACWICCRSSVHVVDHQHRHRNVLNLQLQSQLLFDGGED